MRALLSSGLPRHIIGSIRVDDERGCWLWTRSLDRDGYGLTTLKNHTYQAHRLVYRLLIGEPPTGLVLDHLCRVRHCMNPDHMEPVTNAENLRRGNTQAGWQRCQRCGGEFSQFYGQRRCLACMAAYEGRQRHRTSKVGAV